MFTTFASIQQNKVISLTSKNSGNEMENEYIGRDGYWKPHVRNSFALSAPKISKAVVARKKKCIY